MKTTMKSKNGRKSLTFTCGNVIRLWFLLGLFILLAMIWKQGKKSCKCSRMIAPTVMITLGQLQIEIMDASKQRCFFTFKVTERRKVIIPEYSFWKKPENRNISVLESTWGHLPITYQYLVGSPPSKMKFMSIGISSIYKEKEQHLLETVESIFSHCCPEELKKIVLVIYLANDDYELNANIAEEIKATFSEHINKKRLLVIQSSTASYPPLWDLKEGQRENRDDIGYAVKQNVDYAYLVNFCANLSHYYLMLEDDIVCASNFVSIIQRYLHNTMEHWATVAFSTLGSIGKLYHNADLTRLARFLLMFYRDMPVDHLLEMFYKSRAQKTLITFRPSLFQHIGRVSSFHNIETEIKDPEFEEDLGDSGDFLSASCFTNISIVLNYPPENVCPPGKGVFWGKKVEANSFFTIVFGNPIIAQKIQIYTGSAEYSKDILYDGHVEEGRLKVHSEDGQTCLIFRKIGTFKDGRFELEDKQRSNDIECLRILITAPQKEWLRIRKINIWVKKY
ncbi:alpha-1,3-mannosyl-glycoprotein 4-beta-N-acetylglucosaminyltransferase C-like [Ahaetulla prasina]|uniref:alpha-1,3-mannosyl-glycoprotein 4-beta-N-acetylglucosaminyltransferase C-like n=1 Tax=Ahaetulla prasina TaxID=499056 RepID=UPI002649F6BE|nr:alpha-1,3-mannosyl-glycoprotein 4-beta-N-acetylglucosaminyltransferase C-like [Ahaetulla prasina]